MSIGHPPLVFPPPTAVDVPAANERFLVRKLLLEVRVNNSPVPNLQWVRCRFSFAEPVASAQFMCPTRVGDYNDTVEIYAGAVHEHPTAPAGTGMRLRFKGRMRNPSGEYWPRAVTHNVVGELARAAEFINGRSTDPDLLVSSEQVGSRVGVGGLVLPDVLGRGGPWGIADWLALPSDIVAAVLDTARVPFNRDDIQGSAVRYGLNFPAYIWSSGTPTIDNINSQLAIADPLGPRQAGESALAYIQRYDQVDAEWNGGTGNSAAGGFYRTSEGVGGRVYRWKIGGRPLGSQAFTFTENENILDGSIERQYPTGNRMLVSGGDFGGASGSMFFAAQHDTAFMGGPVYAPNAPSSSMIEWSTSDMGDRFSEASGLGYRVGQDCETVAEVALIEADKITPVGHVTTAEDYPFTQGISVLIQGPGGAVGRLLSGEPFWIQGLTFDCGYGNNGEPNIRQTLEVQGGGVDPSLNPPPDAA